MASEAPTADEGGVAHPSTEKTVRRKIPGGLPYTSSPGVLRRVLEKIPTSEKPSIFTSDFLGTVMGTTGGAARPIIPILKATGLLNQTGAPTELYAQFQTDTGRAAAALQALRNGFGEIFRRNQYAHRADEPALVDVIVAITGLPKKEGIVRYILTTFQSFQDYAKQVREDANAEEGGDASPAYDTPPTPPADQNGTPGSRLQLAYNINVVLPETTNVEVYNAIFRSLKANLLG
ncbi:DUF5343 domain-containing protein [Sphingomonas faeni]|uniref:DUF5343 domain-containing protein n=1 Tax=Sphingomonas faeni TaxID=185950 RepID=UPI00334EE892